jgi:hypothetical protein
MWKPIRNKRKPISASPPVRKSTSPPPQENWQEATKEADPLQNTYKKYSLLTTTIKRSK